MTGILGVGRRKKLSVLDDKRDSSATEKTFPCTLAIRDESSNIDLSLDLAQTTEALLQLTDSVSLISGSSEESRAGGGDPGKLGVKKPRPKASSPNRQGPQQCQVSCN